MCRPVLLILASLILLEYSDGRCLRSQSNKTVTLASKTASRPKHGVITRLIKTRAIPTPDTKNQTKTTSKGVEKTDKNNVPKKINAVPITTIAGTLTAQTPELSIPEESSNNVAETSLIDIDNLSNVHIRSGNRMLSGSQNAAQSIKRVRSKVLSEEESFALLMEKNPLRSNNIVESEHEVESGMKKKSQDMTHPILNEHSNSLSSSLQNGTLHSNDSIETTAEKEDIQLDSSTKLSSLQSFENGMIGANQSQSTTPTVTKKPSFEAQVRIEQKMTEGDIKSESINIPMDTTTNSNNFPSSNYIEITTATKETLREYFEPAKTTESSFEAGSLLLSYHQNSEKENKPHKITSSHSPSESIEDLELLGRILDQTPSHSLSFTDSFLTVLGLRMQPDSQNQLERTESTNMQKEKQVANVETTQSKPVFSDPSQFFFTTQGDSLERANFIVERPTTTAKTTEPGYEIGTVFSDVQDRTKILAASMNRQKLFSDDAVEVTTVTNAVQNAHFRSNPKFGIRMFPDFNTPQPKHSSSFNSKQMYATLEIQETTTSKNIPTNFEMGRRFRGNFIDSSEKNESEGLSEESSGKRTPRSSDVLITETTTPSLAYETTSNQSRTQLATASTSEMEDKSETTHSKDDIYSTTSLNGFNGLQYSTTSSNLKSGKPKIVHTKNFESPMEEIHPKSSTGNEKRKRFLTSNSRNANLQDEGSKEEVLTTRFSADEFSRQVAENVSSILESPENNTMTSLLKVSAINALLSSKMLLEESMQSKNIQRLIDSFNSVKKICLDILLSLQ